LPKVRSLILPFISPFLHDDLFRDIAIRSCKNIRLLQVTGAAWLTRVTFSSILKKCQNLVAIQIGSTPFATGFWEDLPLQRIVKLDLRGSHIRKSYLVSISHTATSLKHLILDNCTISIPAILFAGRQLGLRFLSLQCVTSLNFSVIRDIATIREYTLEKLTICDCEDFPVESISFEANKGHTQIDLKVHLLSLFFD